MYAAYFDMDGTLLNGDSNNFLMNYLIAKKVIDREFTKPLDEFHRIYLLGELSIEEYVSYVIKPFIGMPQAERENLMAGCLHEGGLLAALRPGGLAEIKKQREQGAEVMIVSSTVDYLIEPIARELGVKYVAAAPLEYDSKGRVTGRIAGKIPYQKQKVDRIEEMLHKAALSNEGSYAFGDSINDFEMLCFAQHSFMVSPSPKLQQKPECQHFPVLNWD